MNTVVYIKKKKVEIRGTDNKEVTYTFKAIP